MWRASGTEQEHRRGGQIGEGGCSATLMKMNMMMIETCFQMILHLLLSSPHPLWSVQYLKKNTKKTSDKISFLAAFYLISPFSSLLNLLFTKRSKQGSEDELFKLNPHPVTTNIYQCKTISFEAHLPFSSSGNNKLSSIYIKWK